MQIAFADGSANPLTAAPVLEPQLRKKERRSAICGARV
jgi:hypothetical protein